MQPPTHERDLAPEAPAPPAANEPKGKDIKEANRETMPKAPAGELEDPKQEEVKWSAS
jgi:hypothetical protein